MRVSPLFLVFAACVPSGSSQQQPAPWAQQPPWAQQQQQQGPQQQQVAQAPTAAAGSCAEVFACYTRCETVDAACVSACESGADPSAAGAARQLAVCTLEHQCTDDNCQATNCGTEIQTCVMGGAGTQQPQVATAPTTTNVPAASSGGVHGTVYVGISLTAGGLYDYGTHNIEYRVLWDDGTAARFLPATGLDGQNPADLKAIYTDMIGTYQASGDQVELDYQTSYGVYRETFRIKRDGSLEGVDHVAGTFVRSESLDGLSLDGNWVSGTANWGFQFANGRFHADRDAMLMVRDRQGNILDSLPEGSGSYRVAANTLTLAYDNGTILYIAIASIGDPDRLFINTFPYHRV
jgi:hypothetical protein